MSRAARLDLRSFQQELATRLAAKTAAQVAAYTPAASARISIPIAASPAAFFFLSLLLDPWF